MVVRLIALAWRYRLGCLGLLALGAVHIILSVAGLRMLGLGVDQLRAVADGTPPEWPLGLPSLEGWSPMQVVTLAAVLVLAAAGLSGGVRYAQTILGAHVMQRRLVVDLRRQVYEKLQGLSFRFYDANQTGAIINRVTGDVQGVREFVEVVLLQSITVGMSFLVSLIYMLSLHVPLTLACLATMPVMWVVAVRFSRHIRPCYDATRTRSDELVRHIVEDTEGVHVVKGFAIEDQRVRQFAERNDELLSYRQRIFTAVAGFSARINLLMECNLAVLLGYGGWLVIDGSFGLGAGLMVFAGLLRQLAQQVNEIAGITNSVQNSLSCAGRMFEILDAPVEVVDRPDAKPLPRCGGTVRFEKVVFGYQEHAPILQGIDLTVEAGSCVAILGETGSGKSSLLSLISRFYDPLAGRVLIDGEDVRDLRLDDVRRQVGVVFQESFLFSTTVAENIAFGYPSASPAEIEAAARVAAAHDFIAALPQGYNTRIGERGSDLSGGQRQRLAIARAILTDPRILLLDDATAAIDPETEHEIMEAMEAAMRGRTTFIVAHRLSTLRRADRVVVLERGRIVEIGTHQELMAGTGRYRRAARLQQANAESRRLLAVQDGDA